MSTVNPSPQEKRPREPKGENSRSEQLDWRELVAAVWMLGILAAFIRQMLSALGL